MDEQKLLKKLRHIEALFAGATSDGERVAAGNARERILERLLQLGRTDPAVEYQFSLGNRWSKRLFLALLRRYDLKPYRYRRQRHTTVMVKVPKRFVDEMLWPQFQRLDAELERHLDEIAERVVAGAVHARTDEAEVRHEPPALPLGR